MSKLTTILREDYEFLLEVRKKLLAMEQAEKLLRARAEEYRREADELERIDICRCDQQILRRIANEIEECFE